jgi:NADH-quinone oxidoreductase subunit C
MDAITSLVEAIDPAYRLADDPAISGQDAIVWVDREHLVGAVEKIDQAGFYIESITGLDFVEGYEVVYHFAHFEKPGRLGLRVRVSHDDAVVPSIAGIYGGAEWHEREVFDFHGVVFEGNPNFKPLLLPEDADFHPLQKSEKGRKSIEDVHDRGAKLLAEPPPEPEEAESEGEQAEGEGA